MPLPKITREVKIGFIAIICIASLVWGINFLKGRNVFSPTHSYYAIFPSTNGLVPTNDVTLSGFKIGLVRDIKLLDQHTGQVLVTLLIEKKYLIPHNSIAKLISTDIMGGKGIKIEVAPNYTYHEPGDTLLAVIETGLLDQIAYEMGPVKHQVEGLMDELQGVLKSTSEILNEENKEHINNSIQALSATLASLSTSAAALEGMVATQAGSLRQTIENVNAISANIKDNNQRIDNIIQNISSITDSISERDLASLLSNADRALSEFSAILQTANSGHGSLGRMLSEDSLYLNLEAAAKNLDLLLEDIRENPRRYINVSLIGGKRSK